MVSVVVIEVEPRRADESRVRPDVAVVAPQDGGPVGGSERDGFLS